MEHRKSLNIEKLGKYKNPWIFQDTVLEQTRVFFSSNSKYWLISFVFWKHNTAATKPFSCFLTHFEIQVLYRPVIKLAIARTLKDTLSDTFYMLIIWFKYLQKNTWLFLYIRINFRPKPKTKNWTNCLQGKSPYNQMVWMYVVLWKN